ncbi:MAG: D-glycero-beta-D-manno-heptose 1-phosphate adenylyltransferase [Bacteroidales bacterium]|jgi:rfaE bifunctional protein nucleotidyltransferase chain/domain|nr:D-glycero-beta-D-manno-heptose 1-phosphate adenylyltransferase [Bacteroidales bacterium]
MDFIDNIQHKIIPAGEKLLSLPLWKENNEQIVFTNGCFDIIHRGHADYLARAASLGSKLIVGLNTDASIRRIKGNSRPVSDEYSRAFVLAAFAFIDAVMLFEEDTPYCLIQSVQPDILVKGSDYREEDIVGYDIVKAKGGKIVTIDFVPGFSTSSIIEKIRGK